MLTPEELKKIESAEPGFVELYVKYARQLTDAPLDYHRGCAFVALSATVGNFLYEPLFGAAPNVWCLLLGPSTIYRKTTSLRILEKMLISVGSIDFLPTDFSPQALLGAVASAEGSAQVLLKDEVTGLFSQLARSDYMAGAKEVLIKLFDGDRIVRKLRKEEIVIDKSFVVFIAGGVHERLMSVIKEEDILSGFMVRWIMILPTTKEPYRPLTYASSKAEGEYNRLVGHLKMLKETFSMPWTTSDGLQQMQGEPPYYFTLNNPQLIRFNRYVRWLEESSTDPVTEKINSRAGPLVMKMASLLQASAGLKNGVWGNTGTIDEINFLRAMYYGENFREHTLRALGATTVNQVEQKLNKVFDMIVKEPGIRRGRIMQKLKLSAREMDEIISTLGEREVITATIMKPAGTGRPSTHFKAVEVRSEPQKSSQNGKVPH